MKIPNHIGIILDGNRRWAKERGLPSMVGHAKGAEKLEEVFQWMVDLKIREISLFCFSVQNFDRSEEEKKYLFDLFRKEVKRLLTDKRVHDNKVKIRFAGRLWMLPKDLQDLAVQVMEKTKTHEKYIVNFAMAYGGKEEIVDAANKLVSEKKEITEKTLQENFWVPENMDMVIRTSGEFRTSNFFIWQAAYAELFFIQKYWPDFEKEDLVNCISDFNERERRFGK